MKLIIGHTTDNGNTYCGGGIKNGIGIHLYSYYLAFKYKNLPEPDS